ncbi:MAG: molybdopterin-dependent oxidoreductase, partial [Betaproteobacteria bacterium]|nr:molybdopterin-dependent oxidoreductase [Betaproteobacteria bacterium]
MDIRVATPELLLSSLSEFLAAQMGLHFPRERWGDLERGIAAAASEFGMADVQSCINWLVSTSLTRNQVEILASHLTVGETYFFREQRSFEMLEEHVLPEILRVRGETGSRVRIWSAGCCTGEEPYSIAMLLDRLIPDAVKRNFTILATDINPRFLRKAAEGVYSDWSFRETPAWIRERIRISRGGGGFMETRGLLAVPDAATGRLTLWASHQAPHMLQQAICRQLDLPVHQLRVVAPDVGGGFGPKA